VGQCSTGATLYRHEPSRYPSRYWSIKEGAFIDFLRRGGCPRESYSVSSPCFIN
jgi:hypothetical protein